MVAFLEKPTESDGFKQIVDFLSTHTLRYALTGNPTIYDSCIELFWSTAMTKTINGEPQIHASVDGKEIIITESSVRRDLRLADKEGVDSLPNSTIFENLELIGPKTTAWNEFSSTMASAIICLAINQKFNFLKLIFDSMIRNLDNFFGKFLMYPRKPKRKNTHVPQPSGSTNNVTDETVYKELDNRLVRAATSASSLKAKQGSGNIDKTQSKETPNEASSSRTTSGGSHRCQEAMRDTIAQTRFKNMSKLCNDSRLARGRKINDIDVDEDITLVNDQDDAEMFDVNDLNVEDINTAKLIVDAAQVCVAGEVNTARIATTVSAAATITTKEITLAHPLVKIKTTKPKAKGIVLQEPKEPVKLKKKDQIRLDEETALKLQAEFDEEEQRLARERTEKELEANIAMIETYDDVQEKIDDDH
nr:hypothetical protein [Tanacetum cinerariifolium]